ncbi:MAG: carboxylesterase/lipase family protein [Caulobacteraceae bacterium]
MRTPARLAALVWAGLNLSACVSPGGVAQIVGDRAARPAHVRIADGELIGAAAPRGKAWLGVPYAAPPVGPLRWRAPQPVAAWTTPRLSLRTGHDCTQNLSPRALEGRPGGWFVHGSEDCLVLNVYAPSNATAGQGWPVMVWLHGGGFVAGTAANYDPSLLAQKQGVIVVTLNYRLGALGFLAHPALSGEDPQAGSGDYALLDQQAALRWVAANIAAFGGDPRRVTLFGQSAGAFSVCHQMTAPGAAGLFSGAIIESGACTSPDLNVPVAQAEAAGRLTAADLGCVDDATALACLRAVPAKRVMRAVSHRPGALGVNSWAAAIGGPVLPLSMPQAFATGRFAHMPVLMGVAHDEGRLFAVMQKAAGRLWSDSSYDAVIRQAYGGQGETVLAAYPAPADGGPAMAYASVITDQAFACPTTELAGWLESQVPTHLYAFDDPAPPYAFPTPPGFPDLGAYHASEIVYILQRPWIVADPARFTPAQWALSDQMQSAWGAFARTGDPNGPGAPAWPRATEASPVVLSLSPDAIRTETSLGEHHCALWTRLGD